MASNNWSIRADQISKKFGLTLRQSMKYGLKDSLRTLTGRKVDTERARPGEFWAVHNISFELNRGESLGLMGINGSGKSTLLRILNGVYAPDTGEVTMRGRVGALIAAGAGFAPMLTGRENVHVNGALLGMNAKDISRQMDEIIAFSELGAFIDMPVKNYSSGMFVRLGFAIAAMSKPDILLVDEVLAVGDLNFQKKCYEYLHKLKRNGTSIILVSHSVGAIWAICERGIFMHAGQAKLLGSPEDLIRAYDDQNSRSALEAARKAHSDDNCSGFPKKGSESSEELGITSRGAFQNRGAVKVSCSCLRVLTSDAAEERTEFGFEEPFLVEAVIDVLTKIDFPVFRLTVDAVHYKSVAKADSFDQLCHLPLIQPGRYCLRAKIFDQNFRPGTYSINLCVGCNQELRPEFYWLGSGAILIRHPKDRFLYADPNAVMHLDGDFELNKQR